MGGGVDRLQTKCRFESQFPIGDFGERDIGLTKTGSVFDKWAMTETELPNAS